LLTGNAILDALGNLGDSAPRLQVELVDLECGPAERDISKPIADVYFPTGCLLAKCIRTRSGTLPQVATVGHSGMLGLPVFLGSRQPMFEVRTVIAGPALRMRVDAFLDIVEGGPAVRRLVRRYTRALILAIAQQSICNLLCRADQRVARWLLFASDEVGTDRLVVTHERVAQLLLMRRATVTESCHRLEAEGAIWHDRGSVVIVDRPRLEGLSCDCYRTIRAGYDGIVRTGDRRTPAGGGRGGTTYADRGKRRPYASSRSW
jgi:hypothetical protein